MALAAASAVACQQAPPIVNVQAPPCHCDCAFKASTPQIGKGCWVKGDVLICPLVRRDLDIEPAYPSEDPRCKKLPNGDLECALHPADRVLPDVVPAPSQPAPDAGPKP